jgi:hypothetical protein
MLNPFAQSLLLEISPENNELDTRSEEEREHRQRDAYLLLKLPSTREIIRITTSSPRALFDNFFPVVELA